ncbi:MAG: ABC transporter ATP-binding protein [Candidatus Eisenbacteria bacterium]|nr:ABC transporter ATP-binding protein [Candidatus Eisenbacteria bacterium]
MDIEIRGLAKDFADCTALAGVDLAVESGERVGLVGANGAGKSTLLHILMGFLAPDRGEARVLGVPAGDPGDGVKERIGFVPELSGLLPWATARDLAGLYRSLYRRWDDGVYQRLVRRWEIAEYRRVRELSKGQARLAELALCFAARPDLLLLDEPFHGLDAVMRFRVMEEMERMNRERGTTLLTSSHILHDVEKISRRVVVLREGEILLDRRVEALDGGLEKTFVRLYDLDGEEEDDDGR